MNPIIIECSAKDALKKNNNQENSEWENITAYPITLNQGDVVELKNVFIDTGGSDVSFDDDFQISGQIGFYDVNSTWAKNGGNDEEKTPYEGQVDSPDYKYYLAWNTNTETATLVSLTVDFNFPLDCGFLQPLPFRVSFTYDTPTQKNLTWSMTKSENLTCENRPYTVNLAQWGGEINVIIGSIRNVSTYSGSCSVDPNSFVYIDPVESIELLTQTFNITIPKGTYTRDQLAKFITDNLASIDELEDSDGLQSSNPFLFRTDEARWAGNRLRFYPTGVHPLQNPAVPYYVYRDHTGAMTKYWMGSSQNSLIWDDQANHFSWDFLHTPIANNGEIGIAIYDDTTGANCNTVLHQCGCFFLDLQPFEFWANTMNFGYKPNTNPYNYNPSENIFDICVQFDVKPYQFEPWLTISDAQLRSKITKGLLTTQSLFPNFNRNIADADFPILISTDETVQLKGLNIAGISDTFYLVEINLGNEIFSYKDNYNNQIRAIIGSYYESSNWVQGYSTDSITYTHTGNNQYISKLKIRILDPSTKEPVKTIGTNSYVYVAIYPSGSNKGN